MNGVVPYVYIDKSQYEIIGDIEGQAVRRELIFGFITTNIGRGYSGGNIYFVASLSPIIGLRYPIESGSAEEMAIYDAIVKSEGADFMIFPKFQYEVSGFPPLYKNVKVKVIGKGVKLLTSK
jgi:hypothetical protein